MSRYYDLSQNAVLFGDFMLPMEAFMTTRDTTEMKLVSQIFDFARALAEFRLSDEQLALYSGYILLQDGEYYLFLFTGFFLVKLKWLKSAIMLIYFHKKSLSDLFWETRI